MDDWILSKEYRNMVENMSREVNTLLPIFEEFCRDNLGLGFLSGGNINLRMLKTILGLRSPMTDVNRISKQFLEVLSPFQLSEEFIEFMREIKESEDLSEEEFEKRYGGEIEICKTLGEHGWVVSGHSNPTYIKNWYKALIDGEPEKITEFFEANECQVIKNIIRTLDTKYNNPANKNYYSRGIKAFEGRDYMTSAMYWVGLLETRINALIQFPQNAKYRQKFSNKGFAETKKEQFEKTNSFFSKRYYFLNVYPSLIAFLKRLFVDGDYRFKNNVEPPYINRNWLLHGKCCRRIERYECIQLLNALETIEKLFVKENIIQ